MACRDMDKCEKAKTEIRARIPNRQVECRKLDLSSIASIKEFAEGVLECMYNGIVSYLE